MRQGSACWQADFRRDPFQWVFRRANMTAIHLQPCQIDRQGSIRRRTALYALGDASEWALGTLREWHRRIRARHELARLDDRMLQDIGLTHADREMLANKPFWRE